MKVVFAGGWRGRWEGQLRSLSHWEFITQRQRGRHTRSTESPIPSTLMPLLTTLRNLTWLAVRWRNAINPQPPARLAVPVISIGNVTVGGTGKTPLTQWMVERLRRQGWRPAILMPSTPSHDEAQEHADGGVRVYVGRNRLATGEHAIADGADLVVLDDGFQYRRLHRDLDIALWDATAWLHPANPLLREPLTALRRADLLVLTRADALGEGQLQQVCRQLTYWSGGTRVVAALGYEPLRVQEWRHGVPTEVTVPPPARVVLATGIGNPFYFALTAERAGYEVMALVTFPDHRHFTSADAAFVTTLARQQGAEAVVVTRKDAIKWRKVWGDEMPLWVLALQLRWLWGQEDLWRCVHECLTRCPSGVGGVEG